MDKYFTLNNQQQVAATAVQLALCHDLKVQWNDGKASLLLVPAGEFVGRDGRKWRNDNADLVINNTEMPFQFDENHKSELTADTAACAWCVELENRNGEVWGLVELNSVGTELITDKRYKYYSPGFYHDKDKNVLAMSSVAFTNKPNLKSHIPALNSETQSQTNEEIPMSQPLMAVCVALGVAHDATEQVVLNAVQELKAQAKSPDPTLFVPIATHNQVETALNAAQTELEQLKTAQFEQEVETALNTAITTGKIAPADKEFYKSLCANESGLEKFRQHMSKKAPIIGDSGIPETAPEGGTVALNAQQKQIAADLGLTADEYMAQLKEAK